MIISNGILILSIMFLVAWSGTKVGLTKMIAKIWNYLWFRAQKHTRVGVAWHSCCCHKRNEGVGLVNHDKAIIALVNKLIIAACELGQSNFKIGNQI